LSPDPFTAILIFLVKEMMVQAKRFISLPDSIHFIYLDYESSRKSANSDRPGEVGGSYP
jgi:hypothetical protein